MTVLVNISHVAVEDEQKYRIDFIKEIIDVRNCILEVDGFSEAKLDLILEHPCRSWLSAELGSFLVCGAAPFFFNGLS